jgi:L-ascorbate metabolism protein UlaG (beta-lactamase superfamily)
MKRKTILWVALVSLLMLNLFAPAGMASEGTPAPRLLYQGHGSFRLTSQEGIVIYVDPFAGEGYDLPADIILVTHQHDDHNHVELPAQKEGCVIITEADALQNGVYQSFSIQGIEIEATEAGNQNHDPKNCVGYILAVDGIKLYFAGDTSTTEQMASFPERELHYALLPCDGRYNMGLEEAAACAELIGAKHNIPIHTKPGALFDRTIAEAFDAPNPLIVEAGEEIALTE